MPKFDPQQEPGSATMMAEKCGKEMHFAQDGRDAAHQPCHRNRGDPQESTHMLMAPGRRVVGRGNISLSHTTIGASLRRLTWEAASVELNWCVNNTTKSANNRHMWPTQGACW